MAALKKDQKVPTFNQYETVSPATKLLEKRRKMYEIHQAFQNEKDDFRKKQLNFQRQQQQIKSKDKDFQQNMTKFCQYSQQNQLKKKKAQERARFQEKAYAQKVQQIKSLQRDIEELTKNQKRYQNKVSHFRKYEEYLQRVRTSYSDQYPEMSDILNRHQTLKKSNDDLIKKREMLQKKLETLKKTSLSEEKQLSHLILTINNQSKELSRKIQEKLKEKNQIFTEVQQSNEEFSKKNLTMGKIFMAINNLYYRCQENSFKLKHDFDDKVVYVGEKQRKQFKATKKVQQNNSAPHNPQKNDQDGNFQQKSKAAALKLRAIVSHMIDFKAIIDLYKQR